MSDPAFSSEAAVTPTRAHLGFRDVEYAACHRNRVFWPSRHLYCILKICKCEPCGSCHFVHIGRRDSDQGWRRRGNTPIPAQVCVCRSELWNLPLARPPHSEGAHAWSHTLPVKRFHGDEKRSCGHTVSGSWSSLASSGLEFPCLCHPHPLPGRKQGLEGPRGPQASSGWTFKVLVSQLETHRCSHQHALPLTPSTRPLIPPYNNQAHALCPGAADTAPSSARALQPREASSSRNGTEVPPDPSRLLLCPLTPTFPRPHHPLSKS